jgi:hypothetical protein
MIFFESLSALHMMKQLCGDFVMGDLKAYRYNWETGVTL